MARQPYYVNTTTKQMEVYGNYAGGMVSQAHPEKLRDNEQVLMENVDIKHGGLVQARGGYAQKNFSRRNIFDGIIENGTISLSTGNNLSGNADQYRSVNHIPIQAGVQHVISSNATTPDYFLRYYDANKVFIDGATVVSTFTPPSGTAYVRFATRQGANASTLFQIEVGSVATPYVSYQTPISGLTQGKFRYANLAGGQDIVAIYGKLYKVSGDTYTNIPITNLSSFQQVRPIEAVQVRDKMYFATGSGIVTYDGNTAELMQPHAPTGLEAIYIGTNGLAANPSNYLSDTTGAANAILGVTTSSRYGVINENTTFTAYIQSTVGAVLEYKWETKLLSNTDYLVNKDWGADKFLTANFAVQGDYMVRVSLRVQGSEVAISQYVLPRYKVNNVPDETPEPEINFEDMKLCNRIFAHYDRLFLYGDTGNPDFLYISHLDKFNYFPRTNIIKVTDPLRGSLQAVQQYKNFLVCFTNGSIQMIEGRNPLEFVKSPVHTTLGTKSPYSVQVMKNNIAFVGNDNGVYILKSFNYASEDKLNVERIDAPIQDLIYDHINMAQNIQSCIYDNQYFLYLDGAAYDYVYRFYYENGFWVRDSLPFGLSTLDNVDNEVQGTSKNGGIIYALDDTKFKDGAGTPYSMRLLSKDFNFSMPHHRKKLKQYQILAKMTAATTLNVKLYCDNNLVSDTILGNDELQNTDAQKLKVMASGRFRYVKTDISIVVNELVQLIGFGFVFKQNTPK